MAMNKNLLDADTKFMGQFVTILSSERIIDQSTGREANHSQTGFYCGCDGLFIYYSFFEDMNEVSGMMPVDKIIDVFRADHMAEIMEESGYEPDPKLKGSNEESN